MPVFLKKIITLLYRCYFNTLVLLFPEKIGQQAFNVFSKVRKGKVLRNQRSFLQLAKLEVLSIGKNQIQTYHWPGQKETVVLVHGWESNSWRWRKLIEKLQREEYNIIAFDAPAHGYSNGTYMHVPSYAEVLQIVSTKYKPKTVVGHSFGGMTLLYNEFKNPNAFIEKIITIGSPAEYQQILEHYQDLLGLSEKVMSALDEHISTKLGFKIQSLSTPKFVQYNTKKGLLFHDRFDPITPYQASVAVHKNWKGSELVTTEGFGHSMHQDEVNEKIIDYLNRN